MIYSVTVKRMQVWNLRVEADSEGAAESLGEHLCVGTHPNDDYSYETSAKPSKDQTSEPDNTP